MTSPDSGATLEDAKAAKVKIRRLLAGVRQLRGIGIAPVGSGYCVKVNLAWRPDDLELPLSVDGVPIVISVTGVIEAI